MNNSFQIMASKPPFVMENCVLVTNDKETIGDFRRFIRKHLERFLPRGNTSFSRLMICSGCHGEKDGTDGLNSLDCLTKNPDGVIDETRNFYKLTY